MFAFMAQRIFAGTISILFLLQPALAGPVLLYDTTDNHVLYAENADQPWFAASLTKMMTAYLVFEAWKTGRATPDVKITISAKANAQPKMRLGFGAGKELTYDDAVKALIIVSANDIAYALAEAVSGSEEAFVTEMNAKAVQLGMTGTRYINPHGLPGQGQHTTAQDLAKLANALLRDYPEHMGYFGLAMTEIGKMKKMIATHNPVLVTFEGGDGFKTGFTCSAGYNIVASAMRGGRRLIAIVLGEETSAKRALKANAMLEHGFKVAAWKELFPAPTIDAIPAGFYDRDAVREANLTKRIKDCSDPEPDFDLGAIAGAGNGVGKATAEDAARLTTGSITSKEEPVSTTKIKPVPKRTAKAAAKKRFAKRSAGPDGTPTYSFAAQ